MARQVHPKYEVIRGLDLKNNEVTRKAENASSTRNVQKVISGDRISIEKRKGFGLRAADGEAYGIATYNKINTTTGVITEELVRISNVAHTLTESSITISYTGSAGSAALNIFAVTGNVMELTISEDGVTTLTSNLGRGFDESSIVTLANLKVTIDALTDFSMTIGGDTTVPAASLEQQVSAPITTAAAATVKYWSWTAINTTQATPFSGNTANKNDTEFENTSFANFNGNLYIANGYDELHKYDGQTVYRAGLPVGVIPTAATAAGSLTGAFKYVIVHEQIDNAGNTIQGAISPVSATVSPAGNSVNVTVTNIEDGTGFNTNGAIADGNQTVAVSGGTVTLVVDNGAAGAQTFNAGDTAYLFNRDSGLFTAFAVSSVTGTSLVLTSSVTIQVNDNDPISNQLRIKLYRTKDGGTDLFLVETLANDFSATTQVFNDTTTDANLGAQFIDPVKTPGLPPNARYVTVFQNQLMLAGDFTKVHRYYWSDIGNADNFESFPDASNAKDVLVSQGGKITGIGSTSDIFAVFNANSISYESGDFVEDDIRSDTITAGDIGCVAHATIKEVNGSLFFLSKRGVYAITGGAVPTFLSDAIAPVFTKTITETTEILRLKRALAINLPEKQQYLLWVPTETTNVDVNANANSRIYTFDYFNGEWFSWDSMNMHSGAAVLDDELWWVERRFSTFNSDVDFNLYRQHNTNLEVDYVDHAEPIQWEYTSGWENMADVDQWKKFNYIRFTSFPDPDFEETSSFTVNCSTEIDYIRGSPHTDGINVLFTSQGSAWGTSSWGIFPWGGDRNQLFVSKLKSGKARALRIVLTNAELNTNVLISGWSLEIANIYRKRTRL